MNVKKALCNVHGTWKAFYKCQQYLSQLLQLKKKKKKAKQERPGQGQPDNGTWQKTQSLQRGQSETEEDDISVP